MMALDGEEHKAGAGQSTNDDSAGAALAPDAPVKDGHARLDVQLSGCLASLCRHHNLPFSEKQSKRGLPLDAGRLNIAMIVRAAANVGLKGEMRRENPVDQPALLFPFMVFFKNGEIGVAIAKDVSDGAIGVEIHDGSGTSRLRNLAPSDLRKSSHDAVFLTVPEVRPTANSTDLEESAEKENNWFWPVVRRFWPSWSYVIVATLVVNLLGLALPLFVLNVYDKVIPNESIPTLWALVGGVSIALAFDFILRLLRASMIDQSGERVDLAVSSNIFSRAMDVRMADRALNAGQISNHVREFDSVRDFLSSTAIAALIDIVFIVIFLALFWFIVGELALVPIIAVPVVILVTLMVQIPLKNAVTRNQAAATNRHSVLVDTMVGIETIKAVSAEGVMQKRWEKAVAGSAAAGVAMRFWSSFAVYFTMFAQQAVSVIVIIWGVFLVINGTITIGALIASNILVGRILSPLGSTASTLMRLQQSVTAFRNIGALMQLDRENRARTGSFGSITRAEIRLNNVRFAYPGQAGMAIDGVSVQIAEGEKVGIIGRVGSGKSTLGKLLCGLYRQSEGEVLLDGTDLREYSVADVRSAVGYVSQESELFSGTLRENILIAHPDRAGQLEECVRVSGVAEFAASHPLGLDMDVGERGKALSGGQRQAVGLARTMLAQPAIFYLDEPTSQMDQRTEARLVEAFAKWMPDRTTLLLATHRHSLLSLVDRLIVLEGGKIVADGPKKSVLAKLSPPRGRKSVPRKGGRNG